MTIECMECGAPIVPEWNLIAVGGEDYEHSVTPCDCGAVLMLTRPRLREQNRKERRRMTKTEAIRAVKAMQTTAIQQSAALMGMRSEVEPGAVSIGLGAELDEERAKVQSEIEDAIATARNHADALEHIIR